MTFDLGKVWLDSAGEPIQAHGGGILHENGTYFWFGENKNGETYCNPCHRVDFIGISCYSSRDLHTWKNEGIVLPANQQDKEHDLHPSKVAERPKVIYNELTGKYVMWLHVDQPDYEYARVGIAVSDSPAGPYEYVRSIRPCGFDSRDMTVFKDDDGAAYIIFSSGRNSLTRIAKLADDYLDTTETYITVFNSGKRDSGRESPAVFKYDDKYYMITSGTTGWFPNAAEYAMSDSMLGEWTVMGNPCIGHDSHLTFNSQNTFVIPVAPDRGRYIFMADRWVPENLCNSRYVWLPLTMHDDKMGIKWYDSWGMDIWNEQLLPADCIAE